MGPRPFRGGRGCSSRVRQPVGAHRPGHRGACVKTGRQLGRRAALSPRSPPPARPTQMWHRRPQRRGGRQGTSCDLCRVLLALTHTLLYFVIKSCICYRRFIKDRKVENRKSHRQKLSPSAKVERGPDVPCRSAVAVTACPSGVLSASSICTPLWSGLARPESQESRPPGAMHRGVGTLEPGRGVCMGLGEDCKGLGSGLGGRRPCRSGRFRVGGSQGC